MPRVNDLLSSNINRSIQNQITWSIFYNVKEEGAIGNGAIDDYPVINHLINNKIQGNALVIFPKGEYLIRSNMTVPPNVFLYFVGEGLLKPDAGVTITINGGIIADAFPIFVGEGNTDGSKPICDKIYPQWWGAKGDGDRDDTQSIIKTRSMAGEGSTIFFLSGSYKVTEEDVLSSPAGSRYLAEGYDSTFLFGDQTFAIPTFTTIASLGPDKVVGTDQSGNLQTYDVSAEQLVNMNTDVANMNGRIDNIVAQSGDDNTEIVDARQPATGSAYPVLGARLNDVDAKLADISISVKSFGAKGDSNTDDSNAFQNAIDFLASSGGGVLLVPEGTYLANFILDSNITIKGNGINVSIIKSVPNSNADVIKGRDFDTYTGTTAAVTTEGLRFITIQDITIDGNKSSNSSGYGIRIWGCYWYFENVVVQYCANDGIWTEFTSISPPTEETVRYSALESMFRNIKIFYCDGNAWSFNGPHDSIIDNFVAIGNLGWALYQRDFNSFLTGENWNVWKNGNGFYVGTGLAGHDIVADNDGIGTGLEFKSTGGNSRIVNGRFSGWDVGIILRGQAQNIKCYVQNCGLLNNGSAVKIESLSLTHLDLIAINNNCVFDVISEISKNSFVASTSVPSGKVLQRGAAIRSDSFAMLNSGGTGFTQLPENSLKVKGWTFTFPANNGEILTTSSVPTTTVRGGVLRQNAVPDVAAPPTAGEFNTLLSRLRAAGVILP